MAIKRLIKKIINAIKMFIERIISLIRGKPKLGLIAIGKTGVGKSTLINAVFGEELAKTGVGLPVTKHCEAFAKEGNTLTIYDSKGLESGDNSNVLREIFNLIKTRNLSEESKNHIHICWYCVQDGSNRLDGNEVKTIKEMQKYIPVIIVITQAFGGRDSKLFINEISKMFKGDSIKIIPIMALEKTEKSDKGEIKIKSYGLNELIYESCRLLPKARKQILAKIKLEKKIKSAYETAYDSAITVAVLAPISIEDNSSLIRLQTFMMEEIALCFDYSASSAKKLFGGSEGLESIIDMHIDKIIDVDGSFVSFFKNIFGAATKRINATGAAAITLGLANVYIEILSSDADINPKTKNARFKEGMKNINLEKIKKDWEIYFRSNEAKRKAEELKKIWKT